MSVNFLSVNLEYAKEQDLKKADVEALMEWVNKQPHLPKITELQTILFLQSCYFSIEAAKAAIDNYLTIKTLSPEIFRSTSSILRDSTEATAALLLTALAERTAEDYTIFFVKLMDSDPKLYRSGTSKGHLIVCDLTGFTLAHLTKVLPTVTKKFLYYLQEAIPLRLKGLHFVNFLHVDKLLGLVRPFLNKELSNMIIVHDSVEDLAKVIPRGCLPQEYGGAASSLSTLHAKMKSDLVKNEPLFEWERQQTVDEKQRPTKPKTVNDLFGVEGSFKRLEID